MSILDTGMEDIIYKIAGMAMSSGSVLWYKFILTCLICCIIMYFCHRWMHYKSISSCIWILVAITIGAAVNHQVANKIVITFFLIHLTINLLLRRRSEHFHNTYIVRVNGNGIFRTTTEKRNKEIK